MSPDRLTATFAALADPTRRAILARLAKPPRGGGAGSAGSTRVRQWAGRRGGGTSVTELARPFKMSMPAVSKHLKVLERARLIKRGRDAQWRPCVLDAKPLREVADWLEQYRRHWEQRLDRLDEYLLQLQGKEKPHARKI